MPGGSSWRSPSTADQYRDHDYADFAQEFLSRNADYRRDYAKTQERIARFPSVEHHEKEGLSRRWGLTFPTDPQANPRECPALWSPSASPDVIIVETANPDLPLMWLSSWKPLAEVSKSYGKHLVCTRGSCRLRLCVRYRAALPVPAVSIPCDEAYELRVAAVTRMHLISRASSSTFQGAHVITHNQRQRLSRFLAIHDALGAGASSRDLAYGLIFPNHHRLVGATWKASSERRQVLRLIAQARSLVSGGYRDILLHR